MNHTLPRNPLITEVSDTVTGAVDPSRTISWNQKQKTLPTNALISQLFTGTEIPNGTDLNGWKTPGVFRFDNTILNGPPITSSNLKGYLVVHSVPKNSATGNEPAVNFVRMIVYPDTVAEFTPYTRVYENGTWSVWSTLGSNLRRLLLTSNLTAERNVIYSSFGNYILTLPDPTTLPAGTKVFLEQYLGTGSVVSGSYNITTTPDYAVDDSGNLTSTVVGALVYQFEVVPNNLGTNEWLIDVDNNIDGIIASLQNQITSHVTALDPHTQYVKKSQIDAASGETPIPSSATMNQQLDLKTNKSDLADVGIYPSMVFRNATSAETAVSANDFFTQGNYFIVGDSNFLYNFPDNVYRDTGTNIDKQGFLIVKTAGTLNLSDPVTPYIYQVFSMFGVPGYWTRTFVSSIADGDPSTPGYWTNWVQVADAVDLVNRGYLFGAYKNAAKPDFNQYTNSGIYALVLGGNTFVGINAPGSEIYDGSKPVKWVLEVLPFATVNRDPNTGVATIAGATVNILQRATTVDTAFSYTWKRTLISGWWSPWVRDVNVFDLSDRGIYPYSVGTTDINMNNVTKHGTYFFSYQPGTTNFPGAEHGSTGGQIAGHMVVSGNGKAIIYIFNAANPASPTRLVVDSYIHQMFYHLLNTSVYSRTWNMDAIANRNNVDVTTYPLPADSTNNFWYNFNPGVNIGNYLTAGWSPWLELTNQTQHLTRRPNYEYLPVASGGGIIDAATILAKLTADATIAKEPVYVFNYAGTGSCSLPALSANDVGKRVVFMLGPQFTSLTVTYSTYSEVFSTTSSMQSNGDYLWLEFEWNGTGWLFMDVNAG